MRISDLRTAVSRGLLDFAWRQWAQLGVLAAVTGDDSWAADPEALIVFTLGVARRDPRLFDEVLDWVALNQKAISVQRLRNLASRFPINADLVTTAVAWAREPLHVSIPASREPIGRAVPKSGGKANQLVFSPDVLGFVSRADPVFAEHGFIRPAAALSGKSRQPDPGRPVNFAFRLRDLFGPGTRSEVMRVLLTYRDGPLDAARIADEAAFAKRNVSEALTALMSSGAISATWHGNERHFRASRELWTAVLGLDDTPAFVSWVHLLPAALEISTWLEGKADTDESDYLLASQARSLMDKISRDLQTVGIAIPRVSPSDSRAYLSAFASVSDAILVRLVTR